MWAYQELAGSPHRHGRNEQQIRQSGDAVQGMPHQTSRGRTFCKEADFVAMVERIRQPTEVFDIQVEGSECFFANGILVHNCALIDDPVKSREDADSELTRQKQWDWYINDFQTRLKPNAKQLIVQTRWHQDDLSGRILERDASRWTVLKLPMIAGANDPLGREPGERLWKDWFTDEMVEIAKLNQRSWSALYQQEPAPEEGTYFQRDWFEFYKTAPEAVHYYTTADFAVTDGGGDYTEIATHGYGKDGTLWLAVDGWYGQTTAEKWIEQLLDQIARRKPLAFFGEGGPIRRSIEPFLTRRMHERKTYCRLEWLTSTHDKPTMARSLQSMAAMGKVKLPDTEYGHRLLSQLLNFPAGKYDDAVDMASLMGRAVNQAHPAVMSPVSNVIPIDRWARAFQQREEKSWRTA
jgi:hypothetical protein